MMSRMRRIKATGWKAALVTAALFAGLMLVFSLWINWPYPKVETSNGFTKLSTNAPQRAGEIVAWTKPRVCVPNGITKSEINATAVFKDIRNGEELGVISTTVKNRTFNLFEGYCAEPNYTSIIIPSDLPNGTYKITITACTENPTPRDNCIEPADGPEFTVIGQPEFKLPK
jgi:hypothetical protein